MQIFVNLFFNGSIFMVYMTSILNRKKAPSIDIKAIDFPLVQVQDNFHYIKGATQEYTFLQLVFDAGKISSQKKLIADCCCDMLLSGTSTKTAFELNELLDYYGASIEPIVGDDDLTIRIYCLNKQLENILPVIHEILTDSIFPKEEADLILTKWKQRQLIQFKKTDYVANRKFRNILFGDAHPYGSLIVQEDFDLVQLEGIKNFYQTFIQHKACKIILTGKVDDAHTCKIQATFSNQLTPVPELKNFSIHTVSTGVYKETMPDTVQSSIRIGKLVCGMHHEDYMGLYMLTSILGGYFSSRLMLNIREDKGYTYGIYATIYAKKLASIFEISAEVNQEHQLDAIDEIKKEINRLIDEEIPQEELEKVKNYVLGQMMRSIDGPIKTGKIYKTLLIQNLNFNFSKAFEQKLKLMNSTDLQKLAQKYLNLDSMYLISVG